MGHATVADTIREITKKHLTQNDGLLMGQSISAVGWVNNTVPNCKGIVELPMTDVAGAGFAVGAAMVGRRPIFVIRFQDFLLLNGSPLINYAAKVKELHGTTAPVFVRAIGAEGIGPVHSGVLHALFMHFPGFRVSAPMTPGEYEAVWEDYMGHDDPVIVSEHRASYSNTEELCNRVVDDPALTIYAVSATRFEAIKAVKRLEEEGVRCNLVHLLWLKPLVLTEDLLAPLRKSRKALVVDAGYEMAGASQAIAYKLHEIIGCQVKALGLADRTKCLVSPYQNKYPDSDMIYAAAKEFLRDKR